MITNDVPSQCWRCKKIKEPVWLFCAYCGARFVETRTPAPPSPNIDISFLYDMYSFGWYNHHVSATVLYNIGASIKDFYKPGVRKEYRLEVEPDRAWKIVRAKIFAEYVALAEAFGILCISLRNRKQQSILWAYIHTEPQAVTRFYKDMLSSNQQRLDRLLKLPSLSAIQKVIDAGANLSIPGLPDNLPPVKLEDIRLDYQKLGANIAKIAQSYCSHDSANVQIYNKIKHVFPIVEGQYWIEPMLNSSQASIITDYGEHGLEVAPLPMDQAAVDNERDLNRLVTLTGSEIIGLCISLYRLGIL